MLQKWGRVASRHPWRVIGGWVLLMAAVWGVGLSLGGEASNDFSLPGASSQEALDLLEQDFPAAAGTSATVVYRSRDGADMATDASLQSTLKDSIAALGELDGVAGVVGPFDNSALFSSDGTVALASVAYTDPSPTCPTTASTRWTT